jgi:hypothetical protein
VEFAPDFEDPTFWLIIPLKSYCTYGTVQVLSLQSYDCTVL